MAQTAVGAQKIAAKKAGVSLKAYAAFMSAGLKRCTKCKLWKRSIEFQKDRSRFDGIKAKCRACTYTRNRPISLIEHREKRKHGLTWCVGCQMWQPTEIMKGFSRCPTHLRAYNRELYKRNPEFRYKRRQKTSRRRRNVDAVSPIGEEALFEDFGGYCAYCGNAANTYDHIIPVTQGGRTNRGNIVPACRSCNASKGPKDVYDWMESKGIDPLPAFWDIVILADAWAF